MFPTTLNYFSPAIKIFVEDMTKLICPKLVHRCAENFFSYFWVAEHSGPAITLPSARSPPGMRGIALLQYGIPYDLKNTENGTLNQYGIFPTIKNRSNF